MPADRPIGYLLLLSGMALVGSYVALSRPLTAALPVFLLAWLRFAIAAVAMLPWTFAPPGAPPFARGQLRALFAMSLFGNFLFSILMLHGVSMSSAATAGVVLATLPAVVALSGRLFLRERLPPRGWVAVALAVAGVALLATGRGGADGGSAAGALLLFGCVCCEATYVILGKRLTASLSPMRISALINVFGLALMTPFGLVQALDFDFGAVAAGTWGLLVFYAISASMVSTWLWLSGLVRVPASHSGVFTIALPVASSIVGAVVLDEPFGALHAVALLLAAAGVVMIAWPGRSPAPAPRGTAPRGGRPPA